MLKRILPIAVASPFAFYCWLNFGSSWSNSEAQENFMILAREFGIVNVQLSGPESKVRGLLATKNMLSGETIFEVPGNLVLNQETQSDGLNAATLLLSAQLMQNVIEDEFWIQYSSLLPGPEEFTCGGNIPGDLLELTCDDIIIQGSQFQREELKKIVPCANEKLSFYYGLTNSRIALVDNHLMLVPFMDMMNSSSNPNCFPVFEQDRVILKAIKPIKQGEEVTFEYATNLDARQWWFQFGFVPDDLPPDPRLFPEDTDIEKLLVKIRKAKILLGDKDLHFEKDYFTLSWTPKLKDGLERYLMHFEQAAVQKKEQPKIVIE